MTEQVAFSLRNRNPDVLTCIANLSNDEVFTPPEFANRMLDLLADAWADAHNGASIWADPSLKFLDPFAKSGIFLREITTRLTEGLEDVIPGLDDRVDHILTKQVFGIGITQLTCLIARRSVYCSKWADGKHSIAKSFTTEKGNIWFERTDHTWIGGTERVITADEQGNPVEKFTNGRCKYCGAGQSRFDRPAGLETHAYRIIHTDDPKQTVAECFGEDMQFDVVVGNPPYQIEAEGNTRAMPIYQKFVEAAIGLDPKYVLMITPSRWFAGGLGLDEFRRSMLADRRISVLVDYPDAGEVFPGVEIKGGVSYFLWDAAHDGEASTRTVRSGIASDAVERQLNEFDVLIRHAEAIPILRKVLSRQEDAMSELISPLKPFGLVSNFAGYSLQPRDGYLTYHTYLKGKGRTQAFIDPTKIPMNLAGAKTRKILLPKAGSDGGKNENDQVIGSPWIVGPGSVCSGSFMYIAGDTDRQLACIDSYLRTRFARFLISLRKPTQDTKADTYRWVPQQTWDHPWTDADLYRKYGLSEKEIAFIEKMIRSMDAGE